MSRYDQNADYRIIATAEDAILAKHATAHAKYYRDPFVDAFCHTTADARQQRRRHFQPLIKRGTHARVCVMDRAITAFLKHVKNNKNNKACQIVVLGAGKDTSYFRFVTKTLMGMEEYVQDAKKVLPNVHWYEVDHPSVIQEKYKTIQGSSMLSQCCPGLTPNPKHGGYKSKGNDSKPHAYYHLVPADLRASPTQLLEALDLHSERPTLFLLECVFMYLPTAVTHTLVEHLAKAASHVWLAMYEPILGSSEDDVFGNMMERNLVNAKVASPDCSLLQTRTLDAQLDKALRFSGASASSSIHDDHTDGFSQAIGCDMWLAYQSIVSAQQRQQANQAEFLDELEEWMLIMRHYCFVIASNHSTTEVEEDGDEKTDDPLLAVGNDSPLGFLPGKCHVRTKSQV